MGIKVVKLPGASDKALSAGYSLAIKMRASNQIGVKVITIDSTTVMVRRTKTSEIVLPLLPQFKTFNDIEPWSNEQELKADNYDELFNNLSGVSPIQILTEAEVNDPDNKAGAKILAADFPDTFRVLGASGEPFFQNIYNTYASATSNKLLKKFIDTALIDIVDDDLLTSIQFLEAVEFYNKAPTMFEQLLSQIPDDVCVEDILWESIRGKFSSFPTYNGQRYFKGTQSPLHDINFPTLRPFLTRKTPAGEYITICEVELKSTDPDDFEQLNDFYSGEPLADSFKILTNTAQNSYITIPTKNLFDLKQSRFSTAAVENDPDFFKPLEGVDPPKPFTTMTGRFFFINFNIDGNQTGGDFNVFPEENVLDQIDAELGALFNIQEYHSRFGEGETNFDYFFAEAQNNQISIDSAKVFDIGGAPWDNVAQHNDWVQNAFWFIPIRLNVTFANGIYTGNLIYTVGVYQPERDEFQAMDGFLRIEVLDEYYLPENLTVHPDIASQMATINLLTGTTSGGTLRGEQEENIISSEGNFSFVLEQIHNEVFSFGYASWNQANRGSHFGWTYFEKRSNNKSRTGTIFNQGSSNDIDLNIADGTIQVSQNVIDSNHYIFDHDGTNFILDNNPPMVTLNINSTSSFLAAFKEGSFENISNYTPADFSISVDGYSVFYEPTPGNKIGAYHVGPTSYNWNVNTQIINNTVSTTVDISTPDKFFINDYILDAQNDSVGFNVRQHGVKSIFGRINKHVGVDMNRSALYNRTLGNRFIHFDNETHQMMEGDTVLFTTPENEQIQETVIFGGGRSVLNQAINYDFGTMFENNFDYIYSENEFVGTSINYSSPGVLMSIQVPVLFMRHNADNLASVLFSEIPFHPTLQAYDQLLPIQPLSKLSFDATRTTIKLASLGTLRAVDTNYPTSLLSTSTRAQAEAAGFIFSALEARPIYYSRGTYPFGVQFNTNASQIEFKTIVDGASPGDLIEQDTINSISPSGFMNLDKILIAYFHILAKPGGGDRLKYNEFLSAQFFIDPATGFPIADIEFSGISRLTNEVEKRIFYNRILEDDE